MSVSLGQLIDVAVGIIRDIGCMPLGIRSGGDLAQFVVRIAGCVACCVGDGSQVSIGIINTGGLTAQSIRNDRLVSTGVYKCLGMLEAVGEVFPEAKYQRCIVHFYRNVF